MAFLHGVETIEQLVAGQLIREVRSSVVALVGIAPIGPLNTPIVCRNSTDDAQFGKPLTGFNIPKTLEIIRKIAGGCPVIVVNTFVSADNTTQVTAEVQTVTNGGLKLAFEPTNAVTILNNDNSAATIVAGTDYTIDAYGNFKALSSIVANGTAYKFTYKKLNISGVTASQLVGTVDGTTEARSGFKALDLSYNLFGFNPKIIISPLFTGLAAVAAEMKSAATRFRGVDLIDAPLGTTVAGAIAGRGPSGTINFNTADRRAILLYPQVVTYDTATNSNQPFPYSAFFAGVMVSNDQENGYWHSPSKKEIPIAIKAERSITFNHSDSSTQANALNEAGIVTLANTFGTGNFTWGNRNAAFPTDNSPKNFIAVQRTADMITESLELAALNYLDQPINNAFIDFVREEGNNFINSLIQRGALLPGSRVIYVQEDNSPAELAAGHITFEIIYMPPTPAERITFKSVLDISLYQNLK